MVECLYKYEGVISTCVWEKRRKREKQLELAEEMEGRGLFLFLLF